jgi:nicotinate phosphoribosyltransferase
MTLSTLGIDAYQLTTLVAHYDAGRIAQKLAMSVFFRRLPRSRNYVVFAGLRQLLEHAAQLSFDARDVDALVSHPLLGPALASRPELVTMLRAIDGFDGEIDALPEGTLAFAGPALRTDGSALRVAGAQLAIYTPLMQVRTDIVRAKLFETPWLGFINHGSMVASKAARVADAAAGKIVFEFGSRRTHPGAALDAAYAAHLAGVDATSNLAAFARYGIPAVGTMDHFAVQAAERPGIAVDETERELYAAFTRAFPTAAVLLVDTYDTDRGLADCVRATGGKVTGVRIDSNISVESVKRARKILDDLGGAHVKIFVSDGLDEYKVRELSPYVAGFGVGENISCCPDAATGVGAVAKLVVNGYGKVTMKLSRGSGKATLPGELQTYRFGDHDLVALASETAPSGGKPLLEPLWRGRSLVKPLPALKDSRAYVRAQVEALAPEYRALEPAKSPRPIVASDALVDLIAKLAKEAGAGTEGDVAGGAS